MALPSLLQYESPYPLYGLAFSNSPLHHHRVALTSLITGPSNKLTIVDVNANYKTRYSPKSPYQAIAQGNLAFPATKVGWEPRDGSVNEDHGGRGELLATTGDVLRIWEMEKSWGEGQHGRSFVGKNGYDGGEGHVLTERSVLSNSKSLLPPITSFSWNPQAPNSIVTCSTDTTATLWDINTSQALTQLIAHDKAVYDLSWLPQSSDIFVSVGADGSLRAFDLRTLEHSTILYETTDQTPLARIAFSNREQYVGSSPLPAIHTETQCTRHMLACFGMEENRVLILDMRAPGHPVAELIGHQGPVSGIAWGSGGDDSQLLLYDLCSPLPSETPPPSNRPSPLLHALSPHPATPANERTPSPASTTQAVEVLPGRAWTAESEVNNLAFSQEGDWLGCVSGQKLNVLKV
ncbi:DDB1- and CUL4-associated factor 7, partial [Tremellales sp. Uapishka_1]